MTRVGEEERIEERQTDKQWERGKIKPFGVQVTFISCAKSRDNKRENMSFWRKKSFLRQRSNNLTVDQYHIYI